MDAVRVGVIGLGNIGSVHAKSIASGKIEGMELAALCDIDETLLSNMGKKYPDCKLYNDHKSLIDAGCVDAVIVAVPHIMHCRIADYALSCGINTLVEKPIDVSVSVARKLYETAKNSDKVFSMMFNQRTNGIFKKAKEMVEGGELGELKRSIWIITNWYRTQGYYDSGDWRATWAGEGGGVLLNQAPHNLDLWQWICGMPKAITAFCDIGKYHNIEVEDDVTIFAEYENGATGTFITSTGDNPGTNRLEITGDLGKIVLESGKLKFWKLKTSEREVCFNAKELFAKIESDYFEYEDNTEESGHVKILQNFANAILKGETLIAPGTDGIKELMISNAAYFSSWSGNKKISLPFDEEAFDNMLYEKMKSSKYKKKTFSHTEHDEYSARWRVNW